MCLIVFIRKNDNLFAFCSVCSTNRNMTGTKTVLTHKSSLSNLNGYNTGLPLRRLKTTLQDLSLLVLVGPAV